MRSLGCLAVGLCLRFHSLDDSPCYFALDSEHLADSCYGHIGVSQAVLVKSFVAVNFFIRHIRILPQILSIVKL